MKNRLIGLVFALSAGAFAQCHPSLQETRKLVGWSANAGEIQWTANQPDCKVEKTVPWVAVAVLPPTTAFAAGVLRYSVETNLTPAERSAKIRFGDAIIDISQAAGPRPGMAFTPGRFEMQFTATPQAPKEITKNLFVGSEEPLPFTARLADAVEWLSVAPATTNPGPQRRQTFVITVKTDKLKPGPNQANIQLEATGASNAKEIVPVLVEMSVPAAPGTPAAPPK